MPELIASFRKAALEQTFSGHQLRFLVDLVLFGQREMKKKRSLLVSIPPGQESISVYKFVINRTRGSLATQNFGRICAQRAKHGGQCSNERREQNGTRRRSDHIRVGGFDLVEKRLDVTSRAES